MGWHEVLRPSNDFWTPAVFPTDPFGSMAVGKLLDNAAMPHNKALQPTANPLRGVPAAELGRYVLGRAGGNCDRGKAAVLRSRVFGSSHHVSSSGFYEH